MGGGLPRIDYQRNLRNTGKSAAIGFIFGALFLVLARFYPGGGARLFCGVMGLFALSIGVRSALMAQPRIDLTLSPEGLTYRMFSRDMVPWSEITAITVIRTELLKVRLGKSSWAHQRSLDRINFAVAQPNLYSKSPGAAISRAVQSMGGDPPIAIETWFLSATTEEIADAIGARWSGSIAEKTVQSRG